jgi:hypothetical protein
VWDDFSNKERRELQCYCALDMAREAMITQCSCFVIQKCLVYDTIGKMIVRARVLCGTWESGFMHSGIDVWLRRCDGLCGTATEYQSL